MTSNGGLGRGAFSRGFTGSPAKRTPWTRAMIRKPAGSVEGFRRPGWAKRSAVEKKKWPRQRLIENKLKEYSLRS